MANALAWRHNSLWNRFYHLQQLFLRVNKCIYIYIYTCVCVCLQGHVIIQERRLVASVNEGEGCAFLGIEAIKFCLWTCSKMSMGRSEEEETTKGNEAIK